MELGIILNIKQVKAFIMRGSSRVFPSIITMWWWQNYYFLLEFSPLKHIFKRYVSVIPSDEFQVWWIMRIFNGRLKFVCVSICFWMGKLCWCKIELISGRRSLGCCLSQTKVIYPIPRRLYSLYHIGHQYASLLWSLKKLKSQIFEIFMKFQ